MATNIKSKPTVKYTEEIVLLDFCLYPKLSFFKKIFSDFYLGKSVDWN